MFWKLTGLEKLSVPIFSSIADDDYNEYHQEKQTWHSAPKFPANLAAWFHVGFAPYRAFVWQWTPNPFCISLCWGERYAGRSLRWRSLPRPTPSNYGLVSIKRFNLVVSGPTAQTDAGASWAVCMAWPSPLKVLHKACAWSFGVQTSTVQVEA